MTTLVDMDFDTTPPADETTATTAAHTSGGAGTGFPTITIGSGAAIKWDSDTPHTGTRSLRVDGGNPAAFTIYNPLQSGTDINEIWVRCYMRMLNLPAGNATVAAIYNATPALTAGLQFLTTGQLRIRNGTTTVATTTRAFGAMEWFGFTWHLNATADTQDLKIYDATHSDVLETASGGASSYTGITRRVQFGNVTGWPNSWQQWVDDIKISDSADPGSLGVPFTGLYRLDTGPVLKEMQMTPL